MAANAAGRAAVAWVGARSMELRIAERGRGFGRVERVPGVGPNVTPNEAQLAMSPRGRIVLAWHNLREPTDDVDGPCCSFWRLTVRRGNRFTRSRVLSSRRLESPSLRMAFDGRGRSWVAWQEDAFVTRFYVARITATGRIVDRRLLRSPQPDDPVDLAGLRMRTTGEPELLLRVRRGESQEQQALVSVRMSRPAGPPRTLLISRTVHSADLVLGFDRYGPRLMVWDNNHNAVLAAARRGRQFGRETVLARRGGDALFGYDLATNSSGAAFLGVVAAGLPRRSSIRVSFASPRSALGRPRRVANAHAESWAPSTLLDNGGRADIAWRTTRRQIAIQSYHDGARIGRLLIAVHGKQAACDEVSCPAAAGATVGQRGALFAWRDGRRIRVIRRPG